MEPEIARRCTDCGAAVRGGSFFCPQCGKALKRPGADAGTSSGGGAAAEAAPERPALRVTEPGLAASVIVPQGGEAETAASSAPPSPPPAPDTPARQPSVEGRRRPEIITRPPEDEADGRHRRRRMTTAAREAVEEKLSPRVEKLRHASNVMLEEASYDPSLRFVLVAVAAVILSVLILFLHYLLG